MRTLLPYQRKALAAILAAVTLRVALLVMATGLGKTVVAAALARWWLKNKGTPILFLVHLDDAIKQAQKEFHEALGGNVRFQYLNEDGKLNPSARVVFCTFQTMQTRRRKINRDHFGLVIVDEGHRSMAATYKPTIEHFRADFRFAMTATPNRMDGLDIRDLFGEPVFDFPLGKALAEGALTDVDYKVLLSDVNQEALTDALKRIKSGDRHVTRDQIDRTVFLTEKLEATVERIREAQKTRRKTVIFCQSKAHAHYIAGFFPEAKLYISGIPRREREERLPAFRAGHVRTLITVDKLNEAVDVPDVDHLVFLRQTGSARIWLQQLGRGLRKAPGTNKTNVLVQDFVANCDRLRQVAELKKDIEKSTPKKPRHDGGIHVTGLDFTFSEEARDLLDILEKMEGAPITDQRGMLRVNDEEWGTMQALADLCGISRASVGEHAGSYRTLQGKLPGGQQVTLYALSDVQKACIDLLKPCLTMDENGEYRRDGEEFVSLSSITALLHASKPPILARISSCRTAQGKLKGGRIVTFYALSDVRKACADLLSVRHRTLDEDRMFHEDDEAWGTIEAMARALKLSTPAIKVRIGSARTRSGRDGSGKPATFYALSDVRKACADLLSSPHRVAGKDGTFREKNETWGTASTWTRRFGISRWTMDMRLSSCRTLEGKLDGGQIAIFYALSDVKKACADLLKKKRKK